jgi:hypothetical protein
MMIVMNEPDPKLEPQDNLTREQLEFWIGQTRKIIACISDEAMAARLTAFAAELSKRLGSIKE